ncbi:tetratricopeptide repeat protein [Actinoplanes subglobosus]|uniref:Tetratricopeptide repeat protein n=1 Tax=Actinoplanes subglobosus TaxID=1547892 RepID=A0ABV8ISD3_9ACTN
MSWWSGRRRRSIEAAAALHESGVEAGRNGDLRNAVPLLTKALEMYEALEPDYQASQGAARTLWRLATVQVEIDGAAVASETAAKAAKRWEALLAGPGAADITVLRELTRCHTDLCILNLQSGAGEQAIADGKRAVDLAERLVRDGHPEGRTELGTARHNLAVALFETGETAGAAKVAAAAVMVRQQLAEAAPHPSLADWEHANSLVLSGRIYRALGQAPFAATAFTRALELASSLGRAGGAMAVHILQQLRDLTEEHPGILDHLALRSDTDGAP